MKSKKSVPTLKRKSSVGKFIYTFLIMFVIWIGFTTSFEPSELITGVIVSLIIAAFTDRIFSCCGMKVLMHLTRLFILFNTFLSFILALIKSNFDVARRVISPDLPINPGIVKFKTKLTNGFAKMILANTITLTPGTLTIRCYWKYFLYSLDRC